jgi:hypothetical protein
MPPGGSSSPSGGARGKPGAVCRELVMLARIAAHSSCGAAAGAVAGCSAAGAEAIEMAIMTQEIARIVPLADPRAGPRLPRPRRARNTGS